MPDELATVKEQVSAAGTVAEQIRVRFANSWGDMGAAWGASPAIARVHAYLMSHGRPLTEREVREALSLSHRAASMALSGAEAWGIVERVPELRRAGRRGPASVAYQAVGDPWRWLGNVVAERKAREGDPIVLVLEQTTADASTALEHHPRDVELWRLRDWLATFLEFVRLFDRAIALVPRVEPRELERMLRLLGELPDDTLLRLVRMLDAVDPDDVVGLVDALSRLSATDARRATRLMAGAVRTLSR